MEYLKKDDEEYEKQVTRRANETETIDYDQFVLYIFYMMILSLSNTQKKLYIGISRKRKYYDKIVNICPKELNETEMKTSEQQIKTRSRIAKGKGLTKGRGSQTIEDSACFCVRSDENERYNRSCSHNKLYSHFVSGS